MNQSNNLKILAIITKNKLDKTQNDFFQAAKKSNKISQNAAFMIAHNWREITKTFMFTAIKGIGSFADIILNQSEPDYDTLCVLQTAFSVISDDLNNTHPIFKRSAPKGPAGIHYKWWEDTILKQLVGIATIKPSLSEGTQYLLNKMNQFSDSGIGVAVQLRVVETIAVDIAKTFLQVFNKVEHLDEKIFPDRNDKIWMIAHVEAETIHRQQVSEELSGMARIALTTEAQEEMLFMIDDYCDTWAKALTGLKQYLALP